MSKRHALDASTTDDDIHLRRRRGPHHHAPDPVVVPDDRVRCECGSIARGAPNDDHRCNGALHPDNVRHGHTLCSQCSPPEFISYQRGRRTANYTEDIIRTLGVPFDPPWNSEMSRRRQVGLLILTAAPSCRYPCTACRPRNIPPHSDQVLLRHALRDPELNQGDRAAARSDVSMMLTSHELGFPMWSLLSWVPGGPLEEWHAELRRELANHVQNYRPRLRPLPRP